MKAIRLTLIVFQVEQKFNPMQDGFSKIFLTEACELPFVILSSGSIQDRLRDLWYRYFEIDFDWSEKNIIDFRDRSDTGYEAIYSTYIPPINGGTKSGNFLSNQTISSKNIEIEPHYEQIISRTSRGFAR